MGDKLGKLVSAGSPDALSPGAPVALFESDPVVLSSADILAGTIVEVVPGQEGKALIALALIAHTQPGLTGYDTPRCSVACAGGSGFGPATQFEYALTTTDEWTTFDQQPSVPIQAGVQVPATLEDPITVSIGGAASGDGSATVRVLYFAVDIP